MVEHDLHDVAFPTLTEAQLSSVSRCPRTRLRQFHAGDKLFVACDRDPRFFILESG